MLAYMRLLFAGSFMRRAALFLTGSSQYSVEAVRTDIVRRLVAVKSNCNCLLGPFSEDHEQFVPGAQH